jgi:hypothetical protein
MPTAGKTELLMVEAADLTTENNRAPIRLHANLSVFWYVALDEKVLYASFQLSILTVERVVLASLSLPGDSHKTRSRLELRLNRRRKPGRRMEQYDDAANSG